MVRHGFLLIALAAVGYFGILLYNHAMGPVWDPLDAPLSVKSRVAINGPFALRSGLKYDLNVYIDPDHKVPYEDCLLGQTDAGMFGNCKGHPSVLDVAWLIRDDRGRVLRSGVTPRWGSCCDYDGRIVNATMVYDFTVPSDTKAVLQIRYRRTAAALAPLHPYIGVYAYDAAESASTGEFLIGALLLVVAAIGGIILLSFVVSRYLPIRRAQ